MKSLEENILYQILTLRIALIQNSQLELEHIRNYGYGKEAKKYQIICKEINRKLDCIKKDLQNQYESLEFTSDNLQELKNISTTMLNFKEIDSIMLVKTKEKIEELKAKKTLATKNLDFKEATKLREEAHLLLQYYNENKHYL